MCTTQNCGFATTGRCTNSKQEAFARDAASRTGHSSTNSSDYGSQSYEYTTQPSYAQSYAQQPDGHNWMMVTMIEDDDLMFGGKPLSAWYEEDRRCSMGDEYASSPTSSVDEEELHRGRQRDRPQYEYTPRHHHHHHKHHKKADSSGSESDEDKKQH